MFAQIGHEHVQLGLGPAEIVFDLGAHGGVRIIELGDVAEGFVDREDLAVLPGQNQTVGQNGGQLGQRRIGLGGCIRVRRGQTREEINLPALPVDRGEQNDRRLGPFPRDPPAARSGGALGTDLIGGLH